MLIDELKKRMFAAMKANRSVEKEILRTCIGEVTRAGEDATDERVTAALRKLVKSNEETLKVASDPAQIEALQQELSVLRELLPRAPSVDELVAMLAPVADAIRGAAGDGPATGVAMKFLKSSQVSAEGPAVAQAVRTLRS